MHPSLSLWSRPGTVDIHTHPDGLDSLEIRGAFGNAQIFLQGAHLTGFRPRGLREMLFVSRQSHFKPGKAIRGGIPLIFPWFGPREGHPDAPMHGLVRTRAWRVLDIEVPDQGAARVVLGLESCPETLAAWPHPFKTQIEFRMDSTLRIAWRIENTGSDSFTFEQALHPYFPVADIHSARVLGLQNAHFIDKTSGGTLCTDAKQEVRFTQETDRLYLDTRAALILEDPAAQARLTVTKSGSDSSVVWNPWIEKAASLADLADDEWQNFVCVEQVNAKHNAVTLAPGAVHEMDAEYRLA